MTAEDASAPDRGTRHRLFFALVPGAAERDAISRAAQFLRCTRDPTGSWTDPGRYHLTLRFLGDEDRLRQSLVESARAAAARIRMDSFNVLLDSASSFPGARPPWVLLAQPGGCVDQLWEVLGASLASEGIATESKSGFVPHVTVLRHADRPLPACEIDPIRWRVRGFALIHSQLGKLPGYTELCRWHLSRE